MEKIKKKWTRNQQRITPFRLCELAPELQKHVENLSFGKTSSQMEPRDLESMRTVDLVGQYEVQILSNIQNLSRICKSPLCALGAGFY